jgi:protein SCO1/2
MKTTPLLSRGSNTMCYFALRLLALGTLAFPLHAAEVPCCPPAKPPCCAAEAKATDPHAGHAAAELPSGHFTRESLYQLETTFTDDAGRPFALGSLQGRPVVLTMFFASCNYACPLLVADMTRIREALPPALRERAAIVLVSFDSERDTPTALRAYRDSRGLDPSWILLHGSGDAVRELAALLGVKFKRENDGQFAHSNLISILNPAGEIVHQRAGLKGGLDEAAAALALAAR